jgi:uncharacterized protein (TIGR02453 family)
VARTFSARTFEFLRELKDNNNRPWFEANKPRYEEDVKGAALAFIEAFAPHLRRVSTHFVADPSPVGGSLFRIYRDTRFSRDKTPYKTAVGIRFSHEMAKDVHAPGYYLHISDDEIWAGCGIWRPDSDSLRAIREAIVADPGLWKRTRGSKTFTRTWELGGDSLKRPPKGFDPDHPLVDDLRRKDFIGHAKLPKKTVIGSDLPERFAALCADAGPLNRFLCKALGLEY